MTLLIDFTNLSCECTDHALETIYTKAMSDPPGDDIWTPHHDPYVRDHIEAVTARGLAILQAILGRLIEALGGHIDLAKAETPWMRWDTARLNEVAGHLQEKHPDQYTLDDWLLLVDWIIQRYLPAGVIQEEAGYLAVRSAFAGRVQAALEAGEPDAATVASVMAATPITLVAAGKVAEISGREAAIIQFARARAAELITEIGDRTRHRINRLIVEHHEGLALKLPDATLWGLQSKLQDEFAILNRDWRRVALTEVARNANEGFLATMPEGAKVRRVEAYSTACAFCKKIHGMVFEVVGSEREDKDGWRQVWLGKTNVGRSSSPRKRVGDELVERLQDELWWPAAGAQHPHCRGTWIRVSETPPDVDPKFDKWLQEQLANA